MNQDGTMHNQAQRIVILGAGFGGLYTALGLEKIWRGDKSVEVTLISQDNCFLMTPLLFEAGSGVLEPRHAVTPVRRLLRSTRFVEAEIEDVDLERRMVMARHAPGMPQYEIPFDHLVVDVGGV